MDIETRIKTIGEMIKTQSSEVASYDDPLATEQNVRASILSTIPLEIQFAQLNEKQANQIITEYNKARGTHYTLEDVTNGFT